MRRAFTVSRTFLRSLLVGLILTCAAAAASAQETVPVFVVPINVTRPKGMSKDQVIALVNNENPKVCRVKESNDPKVVLITGISPGTSRVTFKDNAGITEVIDVLVTSETRAMREQRRKEFLDQIKIAVPGARVDALISDNTTVITGTAPDAPSRIIVLDIATKMFAPEPVVNAVVLPGQEPVVNVPRVQQVELDVTVAVVNRSEIRNMSFNWVVNREKYFVTSLIGTTTGNPLSFLNSIATGITGAAQNAAGNPNLQFGVVGNKGSFSGFLEALRTEGLAKILSNPHVVTLSGQKAHIESGGETPVVIATSVGSPPSVVYKPFGTIVDFTPLVLENGRIQLDISAELSDKDDANGLVAPGVVAPGFDTRRARAIVQVEDGQTLAIGGLIQNKILGKSTRVPVLGDIPFLGAAFAANHFEEVEEEMLVLVTPRLVEAMDCCQIPRRLPGRETRSPDDFELFLTQILEAPRGPREVCPDGRYRAAHLNGPTAGVFPCGDSSGGCWQNRCGGSRFGSSCGSGGCGTGGCANGQCGGNHVSVIGSPVTAPMYSPLPTVADAPVPLPTLSNAPVGAVSTSGPEAATLPPISNELPAADPRATPASLGQVGNYERR